MVTASVTGLFRLLLIIGVVYFVLRFLGQFMTAKRNMEAERAMNAQKRKFEEEKSKQSNLKGKTNVIHSKADIKGSVEDVDFEELD